MGGTLHAVTKCAHWQLNNTENNYASENSNVPDKT